MCRVMILTDQIFNSLYKIHINILLADEKVLPNVMAEWLRTRGPGFKSRPGMSLFFRSLPQYRQANPGIVH
jgi:hypothetical protein